MKTEEALEILLGQVKHDLEVDHIGKAEHLREASEIVRANIKEEKHSSNADEIKCKNISLRVSEAQFDEWEKRAKLKDKIVEDYVVDCVEGQVIRSDIISYLDKQAKLKPWWTKKQYQL